MWSLEDVVLLDSLPRQITALLAQLVAQTRKVLLLGQQGFARLQPEVGFDDKLPTSDAAIPALVTGVADLAPDGGEATLTENLSFYEVYGYAPTAITVASGAFDAEGKSNGIVVFVNKDNPISRLTVEQLDGVFGAERFAIPIHHLVAAVGLQHQMRQLLG